MKLAKLAVVILGHVHFQNNKLWCFFFFSRRSEIDPRIIRREKRVEKGQKKQKKIRKKFIEIRVKLLSSVPRVRLGNRREYEAKELRTINQRSSLQPLAYT